MATKKKVLSQDEKREIYVREGWVGTYDLGWLMAWHDDKQKSDKPEEPLWRKLFCASDFGLRQQIREEMDHHGPAGVTLDDITSSCPADSTQVAFFLKGLSGPIKWFANQLDWASVKVIPIESSRLALVGVKPPHESCVLHLDDEEATVEFSELSENDLFDAALNAWEDRAPEREQARRWLCGRLWAAIMVLHDQAGVAFDTSVAVSDDGKRILAADYVVVYRYDGTLIHSFRAFQGVSFLLHKIRLGQPHVIRRPAPKRQQTEEQVMQSVLKPGEVKKIVRETLKLKRTQTLLQIGKLRVLFIEASQIPSGLQPAVCTTAPAPASTPTQPSPDYSTVSPQIDTGSPADLTEGELLNEVAMYGPLPASESPPGDEDDFAGGDARSGVAPPRYNEKGERISKPPDDPPLQCPPFDPGDD
jgi:hypothetical protein